MFKHPPLRSPVSPSDLVFSLRADLSTCACLSACDLLLLRVSAGWLAAVGVTSARAAGLFRGLEADDDSRDGDDTPDSDFDVGIWPGASLTVVAEWLAVPVRPSPSGGEQNASFCAIYVPKTPSFESRQARDKHREGKSTQKTRLCRAHRLCRTAARCGDVVLSCLVSSRLVLSCLVLFATPFVMLQTEDLPRFAKTGLGQTQETLQKKTHVSAGARAEGDGTNWSLRVYDKVPSSSSSVEEGSVAEGQSSTAVLGRFAKRFCILVFLFRFETALFAQASSGQWPEFMFGVHVGVWVCVVCKRTTGAEACC